MGRLDTAWPYVRYGDSEYDMDWAEDDDRDEGEETSRFVLSLAGLSVAWSSRIGRSMGVEFADREV